MPITAVLEPTVHLTVEEEDEIFEKCLPPHWHYEMSHCFAFERDLSSFHVEIRVNFASVEHAEGWLEEFKTLSGATLSQYKYIPPNTYLYRKDFICHRSKYGRLSMVKYAEVC